MILSILYKAKAEDVRMIMIDPKMLELSVYEGIPHLLAPVVTDMKEAANALRWCVAEMERRYRLMAALGVRNIAGYNRKVQEALEKGETIKDPLALQRVRRAEIAPRRSRLLTPLPYIVVIIDELADLMMIVGKKVEELIARLAQKARASGIHLILATQRPSVDVITGLIKANIPTRIAFQVSSQGGLAHDPRPERRREAARPRRHAVPAAGHRACRSGCTARSSPIRKCTGSSPLSRSAARRSYIDEILTGRRRRCPVSSGEARAAEAPRATAEQDPLYDQAVQIVAGDAAGLDIGHPAPSEDRLQPRGADGRDHGSRRARRAAPVERFREVLVQHAVEDD